MKIGRLLPFNKMLHLDQYASNLSKSNNRQFSNGVDSFVSNYKNTSIVDIKALPLKAENNTLVINECFSLGLFDGKEIQMRIFSNGGLETTNCPRVPYSPPGTKVTPEQKRLAEIYDSFSTQEHKDINKAAFFVHKLWSAAKEGKVDTLNELIKNYPDGEINVKDELSRLGIDYNEPFVVNGKTFTLNSQGEFSVMNYSR
ncbi:MAG: hypothetical protein ACOWWO_11460 [Peptococcaceae bacterium]